ncbi:tyrosine--tRNA ligase [bacterium]|nr:tyrosine--tRNA ligase [bacterium]
MQRYHFIEELRWRGMLHDAMPGTEEKLVQGKCKGYIGFDPTADSLGVGNLVQVMTLLHFQRSGHQPYALIGGATGMVGDPSGKSEERNLLDLDQLRYNQERQKAQLERFLDFTTLENPAVLVNNYDWFKDFSFLGFIRDVGKHLPVNYMMAKDSVKRRLETGMSFTEFSYQLIQGYDFYHLWKEHGMVLQMGGSDQWGNITTGTELIRRMAGGEAYALTTPLIKKADGTKFGKSESGNIWLDPARTSAYHFYQFWLNAADADAPGYLRIFSLKSREEIEALESEHQQAPHLRLLQKALAEEVTTRVHSAEATALAQKAADILFGKAGKDELFHLDAATLHDALQGVETHTVSKDLLGTGPDAVALLAEHTAVFPSKSEARKMLQANGVSVNKEKIVPEKIFGLDDLFADGVLLIQKGKKNYLLIKAV